MENYLRWKVVPPDYNNPFKPPVPEHILKELTQRRMALRRVCKLKCLCEGFELMSFDNLDDPTLWTEHPCISAMGVRGIIDYINASSVHGIIEQQLHRIEEHMRELIAERERTIRPEDLHWSENLTVREFRARREQLKAKFTTASGDYRVRYARTGSYGDYAGVGF